VGWDHQHTEGYTTNFISLGFILITEIKNMKLKINTYELLFILCLVSNLVDPIQAPKSLANLHTSQIRRTFLISKITFQVNNINYKKHENLIDLTFNQNPTNSNIHAWKYLKVHKNLRGKEDISIL